MLNKAIPRLRQALDHENRNIEQHNREHTDANVDATLTTIVSNGIKTMGDAANAGATALVNGAQAASAGATRSSKNLGRRGTSLSYKTFNLCGLIFNQGSVIGSILALLVLIIISKGKSPRCLIGCYFYGKTSPHLCVDEPVTTASFNSSFTPGSPAPVPPSSVPFYPAIATAAAATGGNIYREEFLTEPIIARLAGQFCRAFKDATGAGGNPPLVVDISSTCQQCVQRTEGGKTSRLGILSCRAPGHFTHFLSHYESM